MDFIYNCMVKAGIIDKTPIDVLENRVFVEIDRCAALIQDTDQRNRFINQEETNWKAITSNKYYQDARLKYNVHAKHFSNRTIDRLQYMYPMVSSKKYL